MIVFIMISFPDYIGNWFLKIQNLVIAQSAFTLLSKEESIP